MNEPIDLEHVSLVKASFNAYEKHYLDIVGAYDYVVSGETLGPLFNTGAITNPRVYLLGMERPYDPETLTEFEEYLEQEEYTKVPITNGVGFAAWTSPVNSHGDEVTIVFTEHKTRQDLLNQFFIKHLRTVSYHKEALHISSYAYSCIMNKKFSVVPSPDENRAKLMVEDYLRMGWVWE